MAFYRRRQNRINAARAERRTKHVSGYQGRTGRFSLMSSEQRRRPPTLARIEFMERTSWHDEEPDR